MGVLDTVTSRYRAGLEKLSGKSIDLGDNALTGTAAQFNAAVSDDDFVPASGLPSSVAAALAPAVHAATAKTTPVDADEMLLVDSASTPTAFGLKRIPWSNLTANLVAAVSAAIAPDLDTRDALTVGEATMPRRSVSSTSVVTGNGALRLTYFTARKTETVTKVRALCGATAMAGATLCRIGVYSVDGSGNLTLVASTASDTTLFAATSTPYTKTLQANWNKVRGTRYAVGILVVGTTTAPTLVGQNTGVSTEEGMDPRLGGTVGSQTDLPSTVAVGSITDLAHHAYVVVSP